MKTREKNGWPEHVLISESSELLLELYFVTFALADRRSEKISDRFSYLSRFTLSSNYITIVWCDSRCLRFVRSTRFSVPVVRIDWNTHDALSPRMCMRNTAHAHNEFIVNCYAFAFRQTAEGKPCATEIPCAAPASSSGRKTHDNNVKIVYSGIFMRSRIKTPKKKEKLKQKNP